MKPEIIFTLSSSAIGGAEYSTWILAKALAHQGERVKILVYCEDNQTEIQRWWLDRTHSMQIALVSRIDEYQRRLLTADILIGTHRTLLIDSNLQANQTYILLFRASVFHNDNSTIRIVSPDGALIPMNWTEYPWELTDKASTVVAPSNFAAISIRKMIVHTSPPVICIPNIIDFSQQIVLPPHSQPHINIVSRLVDWRNIVIPLNAAAKVATTNNTRVNIYGNGPLEQYLKAAYKHAAIVSFHGFQVNPWQQVHPGDIALHTSPRDAFGRAAFEAMAWGQVIVAHERGVVADALTRLNYEFLCNIEDESSIEAALYRVFNLSEQERMLIGKQLRNEAYSFCNTDGVTKKWIDLFNKI